MRQIRSRITSSAGVPRVHVAGSTASSPRRVRDDINHAIVIEQRNDRNAGHMLWATTLGRLRSGSSS